MPNIFVFLMMLSTAFSVLMLVYVVVKHTVEKSLYLILLSVANLFFVFGSLLEITAPALETAFYGVRVQYIGAPFLLPLIYLFFRDFYGKKRFTPLGHVLFFLIPVLSMLALQAHPFVRLHYGDIRYITNGQVASVQHTSGVAYYLGIALNYICIVLSLRLILKRIIHGPKRQRRYSLVLLSGWVVPVATNAFYVFGEGAFGFDFTPIAYVTSTAVLLYSALVDNLLDALPLARAQVMDEMEDAFIVCDDDLCFLDANRAAKRLFPELSGMAPGESMQEVKGFKSEGELRLLTEGEELHYKITATHILRDTKSSGICIVFRNVTVENRLLENLQRQATVDALTGVYNRGTFFDAAAETLRQGKESMLDFALLMLDLDYFKRINDTYGHPCGDAVLKAVADAVKAHFRKGDVVGRYGGEEFAVLLANLSAQQALTAAEKLREEIGALSVRCGDESVGVTISIGVAHGPAAGGQTLQALLTQADEALYLAKSGGRNRTSLYSGKEAIL